ncbi:hypothetical protein E8E13_010235 [Curvularia kusanoi]|uniref:Uncharacterized protein n=1 Tax=Curvularia kusanoi TaxID=90978 RepID=A0A9P4TIE4_CURKU|nr:hypothetical protein E8E13_010235 [Curvularia kusanoi]
MKLTTFVSIALLTVAATARRAPATSFPIDTSSSTEGPQNTPSQSGTAFSSTGIPLSIGPSSEEPSATPPYGNDSSVSLVLGTGTAPPLATFTTLSTVTSSGYNIPVPSASSWSFNPTSSDLTDTTAPTDTAITFTTSSEVGVTVTVTSPITLSALPTGFPILTAITTETWDFGSTTLIFTLTPDSPIFPTDTSTLLTPTDTSTEATDTLTTSSDTIPVATITVTSVITLPADTPTDTSIIPTTTIDTIPIDTPTETPIDTPTDTLTETVTLSTDTITISTIAVTLPTDTPIDSNTPTDTITFSTDTPTDTVTKTITISSDTVAAPTDTVTTPTFTLTSGSTTFVSLPSSTETMTSVPPESSPSPPLENTSTLSDAIPTSFGLDSSSAGGGYAAPPVPTLTSPSARTYTDGTFSSWSVSTLLTKVSSGVSEGIVPSNAAEYSAFLPLPSARLSDESAMAGKAVWSSPTRTRVRRDPSLPQHE